MASTEDIEAKLAAYVDDDLDASSREEIEKHLAGNPQHRQLIADLMQQRTLVQSLPRELAPADLSDALSAQLERAVLLGDVDSGDSYSRLRINRWPQIRAVAAVVMLAGGLFAAIYYLLPSPGMPQPELTSIQALPATRPGETVPVIDTTGLGLADRVRRDDGVEVERLGKGGFNRAATEQEIRAKGALAEGPTLTVPGSSVWNVAPPGQQMFQELVVDQMRRQGGPNDNSVVLVVNTDNPDETNRRIVGYLAQNQLRWEAQTEPLPGPLNLSQTQVAAGSRLRDEQVHLKVMVPTSGPAGGRDASQVAVDSAAGAVAQQQEASPIQVAPAEAKIENAQSSANYLSYQGGRSNQVFVARGVPRRQLGEMQRDLDALTVNPQMAAATRAREQDHYKQAEAPAIGTALAAQQPATTAPATQPAALAVPTPEIAQEPVATTQPVETARRIAVGDVVSIDIPGLVGPGAVPRNEYRIEPGGTITLLMLEPFSCLGMTSEELSQSISGRYQQINIPGADKVTVSLAAPTTQESQQGNDFGLQAAPQPAADLVDVVILVQPLATPTTQPQAVQVAAPAASEAQMPATAPAQ